MLTIIPLLLIIFTFILFNLTVIFIYFCGLNTISDYVYIISMSTTLILLYILYVQLVYIIASHKYFLLALHFYKYFFQSISSCNCLLSPSKYHVFVTLPFQIELIVFFS